MRHKARLPSKVVDAHWLEEFKAPLVVTLMKLIWWQVSLPFGRVVGLSNL